MNSTSLVERQVLPSPKLLSVRILHRTSLLLNPGTNLLRRSGLQPDTFPIVLDLVHPLANPSRFQHTPSTAGRRDLLLPRLRTMRRPIGKPSLHQGLSPKRKHLENRKSTILVVSFEVVLLLDEIQVRDLLTELLVRIPVPRSRSVSLLLFPRDLLSMLREHLRLQLIWKKERMSSKKFGRRKGKRMSHSSSELCREF